MDIEDVVQEMSLSIHLKRHTWDPEKPVAPWVMAIARNKLIDSLQAARAQAEHSARIRGRDARSPKLRPGVGTARHFDAR